MSTVPIDPVRKSIRVRAPLALSFDVFTTGLTRWWPQDHGIARKPVDKMVLEPRLGGRWLEISKDGTRTPVATIVHWDPPHRFTLIWQVSSQWLPDETMRSEVDIRFTADGPDTTVVEVLHHKFETMGPEAGAKMRNDVNGGWPGLLERFAREAERSSQTKA
ncbi:MAG TPA: SRPBCC family protein [Gammaproteobacteria bacterium]|nr:SRPBCC family protein [Gammaproteobacteria bacterium]